MYGNPSRRGRAEGFTLVEVLMAMMILGIAVTGIVVGFLKSLRQAEWSAYSLAAQSLAMQPIEQARGAKWDPYANPPVDQIATMPTRVTNILDIPISGMNIVYATNATTVRTISATPPLKEITVICTWQFMNRGVFSNTMVAYRAPDQ